MNLIEFVRTETRQEVSSSVVDIAQQIAKEGNIAGILFYGSGLWKTQQTTEDDQIIFDFYVLVDQFSDIENRLFFNMLGFIMPPNVYYKSYKKGDKILRSKYAVMRIDQFDKACQGKSLTPQIWARFCQPTRIVYCRDQKSRQKIEIALSNSVLTFHKKTMPLLNNKASAKEIWIKGLRETYGAELRSEKPERLELLYQSNQFAFEQRTEYCRSVLISNRANTLLYFITRLPKRIFQKTLAFIRLMKATFTFEGSVDYALWKIKRQSGVAIDANDFQRKYPLIGGWPLLYRLWRKGAFSNYKIK